MNLKGIKKLVIYGLTTLIGFNLFVACDYSTPYYPVITNDGESDELSPIVFNLNSEMSIDENGYYHVALDTTKWQTTHRISGNVFRDDNPVNIMIAPVKTMLGDTAAISYGYFDNWREEETYGSFNIIFD